MLVFSAIIERLLLVVLLSVLLTLLFNTMDGIPIPIPTPVLTLRRDETRFRVAEARSGSTYVRDVLPVAEMMEAIIEGVVEVVVGSGEVGVER